MRIRNPWYESPVEAEGVALAPKISAYLQGQTAMESLTLDELAAAVPEVAAASEAAVNVALQSLGVKNA